MERKLLRRAICAWVAIATACAVGLINVLPHLGASPAVTSDLLALSVGILVLAAASGFIRQLHPVMPWFGETPGPTRQTAPIVRGQATDPQHHPLAPRAPGLA